MPMILSPNFKIRVLDDFEGIDDWLMEFQLS